MAAALLILVSTIFLHELGHWFVARLWKFKTPVLAVGIGPTLFKFNWLDTEWRLGLLPFGGYVEIPQIARSYRLAFHFSRPAEPVVAYVPKKEVDGTESRFATGFQRMAIAAAGPLVNFLLGIGLLMVLLFCRVPVPAAMDSATIGFPVPGALEYATDSPAILMPGDLLRPPSEIRGKWSSSLKEAPTELNQTRLGTYYYRTLRVTRAKADGSTEQLEVKARLVPAYGKHGYASLPVLPLEPVIIQTITQSSAPGQDAPSVAAAAGLKPGDRWLSLGGARVSCPAALAYSLKQLAGKPDKVSATLQRDGSEIAFSFTVPKLPDQPDLRAWLGFTVETEMSTRSLFSIDLLSVHGILSDIQQEIAIEKPGTERNKGTLGLMELVRDKSERSGISGLLFVAMIANLAVMFINLFPIPPLDGSRILEGFIEIIIRQPVPAALTLWKDLFSAGFILTMLLSMFFRDAREMGHAAIRQVIPGPRVQTASTNSPSSSSAQNDTSTDTDKEEITTVKPRDNSTENSKRDTSSSEAEQLRKDVTWLRSAEAALRGHVTAYEGSQ